MRILKTRISSPEKNVAYAIYLARIYLVTSSGPEHSIGRLDTNFTSDGQIIHWIGVP